MRLASLPSVIFSEVQVNNKLVTFSQGQKSTFFEKLTSESDALRFLNFDFLLVTSSPLCRKVRSVCSSSSASACELGTLCNWVCCDVIVGKPRYSDIGFSWIGRKAPPLPNVLSVILFFWGWVDEAEVETGMNWFSCSSDDSFSIENISSPFANFLKRKTLLLLKNSSYLPALKSVTSLCSWRIHWSPSVFCEVGVIRRCFHYYLNQVMKR